MGPDLNETCCSEPCMGPHLHGGKEYTAVGVEAWAQPGPWGLITPLHFYHYTVYLLVL